MTQAQVRIAGKMLAARYSAAAVDACVDHVAQDGTVLGWLARAAKTAGVAYAEERIARQARASRQARDAGGRWKGRASC